MLIRVFQNPAALDAFMRDQNVLQANPRIREIVQEIATLLQRGNVIEISLRLPGRLDELGKEFPQFFDWAQKRIEEIVAQFHQKQTAGAITPAVR